MQDGTAGTVEFINCYFNPW